MCGFGQIIFLGQNVPRRLLHLKPKLSTRQQFAPLILYDAPLRLKMHRFAPFSASYQKLRYYPTSSGLLFLRAFVILYPLCYNTSRRPPSSKTAYFRQINFIPISPTTILVFVPLFCALLYDKIIKTTACPVEKLQLLQHFSVVTPQWLPVRLN